MFALPTKTAKHVFYVFQQPNQEFMEGVSKKNTEPLPRLYCEKSSTLTTHEDMCSSRSSNPYYGKSLKYLANL